MPKETAATYLYKWKSFTCFFIFLSLLLLVIGGGCVGIVRFVLFFFFCSVSFDVVVLRNGRRSRSTNDRIVSTTRSHIAVVPRRQRTIYRATGYLYRINIGLPIFRRTRFTNVPACALAFESNVACFIPPPWSVLGRNSSNDFPSLANRTTSRGSPWF